MPPYDVAKTSPPLSPEGEAMLRDLRKPREPDTLLIVYHQQSSQVFRLADGATLNLGRDRAAEISISDTSVSRRHASFEMRGGVVTVVDLGSTYGTRLNGERIERATMELGDEVSVGNVTVVIHALAPSQRSKSSLWDHDQFLAALDDEVERARTFGRGLAVLSVQAEQNPAALAEALSANLRKVDRLALYGDGTLELLLPELNATEAKGLVRAADASARFGLAIFPADGTSSEVLLAAARAAMRRTGPEADRAADERASELLFVSPAMRAIDETLKRVAASQMPVLLRGETGTGKEVLARLVHEGSSRAGKPFVAVNCGAIPATLVESVLFGHERGAFTGAHATSEGVFEQASGGTLLLDELGELPLPAQAALLRVLETKELKRVGGKQTILVDVRVLAATHRDLDAMVVEKTFRQDLLYRLNTMTLDIPALRERPEEIGPFVAKFLAQANALNGRSVTGFNPEAMRLMLRYSWPGNIRELRNAVEHAVVVTRGQTVSPADLPRRIRDFTAEVLATTPAEPDAAGAPKANLKGDVARYETQVILEALRETGGNRTEAARRLNIPVRTLSHKIRRYGIVKLGFGVDTVVDNG